MIVHANREELAGALARAVSQALSRVITEKGKATLAVSGGTTPQRFFELLSHAAITWNKVTVTLVDERQVDDDSPRSNARLVKAALLQNNARVAGFAPLFRNEKAAALLHPDVVVLGMGADGHTASFFPGGDTLSKAIDPQSREGVMAISAPAAGEPRLTFTLARLLPAKLFLHIEGVEKRRVLAEAQAGKDAMQMPIRAVLHSGRPLSVYWCP
ncbi:MAG: 6-phosphogluconolactonase [Proteobacteria bacterium]|nr:6-phosphogluconolactonase [Pseudomonadota bacterium]